MSSEHRRVEWEPATTGDMIAAAVLIALLTPFVRTTGVAIVGGGDGLLLIAALGLGIAAADFITGFLHWLCDTYFAEDTPIIGPAVIEPFREHHRDPLAMTRRAFAMLQIVRVLPEVP